MYVYLTGGNAAGAKSVRVVEIDALAVSDAHRLRQHMATSHLGFIASGMCTHTQIPCVIVRHKRDWLLLTRIQSDIASLRFMLASSYSAFVHVYTYRVAETHMMLQVAGHFPQKSY